MFLQDPPNEIFDFSLVVISLVLYSTALAFVIFKAKVKLDTSAKFMTIWYIVSCLLKFIVWVGYFYVMGQRQKRNDDENGGVKVNGVFLIEDYFIWFFKKIIIYYFFFEMDAVTIQLTSENRDQQYRRLKIQKYLRWSFFISYSFLFGITNGLNIFFYFYDIDCGLQNIKLAKIFLTILKLLRLLLDGYMAYLFLSRLSFFVRMKRSYLEA